MAGMIDESGDYMSREFLMKIISFLSLITGILFFIIFLGFILKILFYNFS